MTLLLLTTTFYFDLLAWSRHCKSLEVQVANGNKISVISDHYCVVRDLGWQSLENRRKNARLALFYRGLHSLSAIPCDSLRRPVPNS